MAADLIRFDSLSLKVNVRHASISCTDCCSRMHRNPDADTTHTAWWRSFPPSLQSNSDRISTCPGVCFSLLSPTRHRFFLSVYYWLTMRWSAANFGSKGEHQSSTVNKPRPVFLDQSLPFWSIYYIAFTDLKKLYCLRKVSQNSLNPTGLPPCSSRGMWGVLTTYVQRFEKKKKRNSDMQCRNAVFSFKL